MSIFDEQEAMIEVPHQRLDPDTLARLCREFVLREGTDYGHEDFTTEEKVDAVLAQIRARAARIHFDPESESFTIAVH